MIATSIILAFMSSVIGYVYSTILIQPGEILHPVYSLFRRLLSTREIIKDAEVPEELIGKIGFKGKNGHEVNKREIVREHWLLKPLGRCEKCTSGQISFWLFLYYSIQHSLYFNNDCIFTIINHIFTVCMTILLTITITKLLNRL